MFQGRRNKALLFPVFHVLLPAEAPPSPEREEGRTFLLPVERAGRVCAGGVAAGAVQPVQTDRLAQPAERAARRRLDAVGEGRPRAGQVALLGQVPEADASGEKPVKLCTVRTLYSAVSMPTITTGSDPEFDLPRTQATMSYSKKYN